MATRKGDTMSQPTPGAKTCGCRMDVVADDSKEPCDLCSEGTGMNDGVGWTITYCPLHAQAEAMREALKLLVIYLGDDCDHPDGQAGCVVCDAHAVLRAIEGA